MGHGAKATALHREWSWRVTDEFLQQGDSEKELGLPISAGMDRNIVRLETSQHDFLTKVMFPLFSLYASHFTACKPLVNQIQANLNFWEKRIRELNL